MPVFDEFKSVVKDELNAADLGTLKSAFDGFIKGNEEERAAATAIATNVKDAVAAFMEGTLSRHSMEFVLNHSREASLMLAEARAIRLKRTAIRTFYNIVLRIVLKKL